MTYFAQQPWLPFSEVLLDWDEAFHDLMLNDRLRMRRYREAIFETVREGHHVLDLGTGTGILSQWALEAGAARVYGIDLSAPILALATQRIEAAGLGARFEPIHALSYEVTLPRRVDVLISEIIGNLADNEDFQPVLQDAIARFLAPDGVALPRSTRSFLVPVCAPEAHRAVRDGRIATLTPHYDIDSLYRDKGIQSPFNLYYDCIVPRSTYLGRPAQVCHYQGAWDQAATYTRELQFTIERGGTLTGFKGYFVAELSRSTVLDISGDEIEAGLCSDSWKHAYLPIERPLDVREGDTLALSFSRQRGAGAFRQLYGWRGSVARGQQRIAEFTQHMSES